ncbi:MAG: TetR/AcrR family transcriptional regulator [Polyangiaceae bacterium]|nr:TetR/AcrR family transcriptional regulator [Polyangiaceae bacterium]
MTTSTTSSTRRTRDVRTRGRAADVVERILQATAEQLSEVGFAALRVDDIAARSGVNKTTIYRRWPTRASLVDAAIRRSKPPAGVARGSTLKEEALAIARDWLAFHESPMGRGIVRVIQTEVGHPELEPIVRELRADGRRGRIAMVQRAIDRGELPPDTDAALIADMIFSPLTTRLVFNVERVDEQMIARTVDIVVAGLKAV